VRTGNPCGEQSRLSRRRGRHFSDLFTVMQIIKGQPYRNVSLLLTGVLLLVLRAKNGDDAKASLADVDEIACDGDQAMGEVTWHVPGLAGATQKKKPRSRWGRDFTV
jgi:hypothetical protein